jgi:hypothetical protein
MIEPTSSRAERRRDLIHDAGLTSASQEIGPFVATPPILLDPNPPCDRDRHRERCLRVNGSV